MILPINKLMMQVPEPPARPKPKPISDITITARHVWFIRNRKTGDVMHASFTEQEMREYKLPPDGHWVRATFYAYPVAPPAPR